MNKYSKLNKEELLEICKIIHPETKWEFRLVVDEEGNCHDYIGDDESILQFNLLEDETDELRFYYKGDIDGDLFDIGEDMVRNSEDKINDYLYRLINKNQEVENENFSGDDYNFTEDEIKSLFINEQGVDKFTKIEEYKSNSINLDNTIFNDLADAQAGISSLNDQLENISARLQRSNFSLYLSLIYRKKSGQDTFILKIHLFQFNMSGYEFKVGALKDGKITFLFDDSETMHFGNVINYQEGTSEELYLETDISLLSKIINTKTIEYRVLGAKGIVSESKLSNSDIMNFVGFYNVLLDSTFRKDEILSFMIDEKKKEEKKKIIEAQKEKDKKSTATERKEAAKAVNSSSSCFVVTATMNDPNHPIVNDYRLYRDRYLLNNKAGLNFVKFYYSVGPYFASLINNNETLRKISFNTFIKPLHKLIQKKIDTNNN